MMPLTCAVCRSTSGALPPFFFLEAGAAGSGLSFSSASRSAAAAAAAADSSRCASGAAAAAPLARCCEFGGGRIALQQSGCLHTDFSQTSCSGSISRPARPASTPGGLPRSASRQGAPPPSASCPSLHHPRPAPPAGAPPPCLQQGERRVEAQGRRRRLQRMRHALRHACRTCPLLLLLLFELLELFDGIECRHGGEARRGPLPGRGVSLRVALLRRARAP